MNSMARGLDRRASGRQLTGPDGLWSRPIIHGREICEDRPAHLNLDHLDLWKSFLDVET